jgi:hypothetical protein
MKIETKFNVNDIVEAKRSVHGDDSFIAYEIMEILSNTCYVGTQIDYLARPMLCTHERIKPYGDEKYKWKIDVAYGKDIHDSGWKRYREDELIEASNEARSVIIE